MAPSSTLLESGDGGRRPPCAPTPGPPALTYQVADFPSHLALDPLSRPPWGVGTGLAGTPQPGPWSVTTQEAATSPGSPLTPWICPRRCAFPRRPAPFLSLCERSFLPVLCSALGTAVSSSHPPRPRREQAFWWDSWRRSPRAGGPTAPSAEVPRSLQGGWCRLIPKAQPGVRV